MTDKMRREIARKFRALLDGNVRRKVAILQVCADFGVSRASLYRVCKEFNVSTA